MLKTFHLVIVVTLVLTAAAAAVVVTTMPPQPIAALAAALVSLALLLGLYLAFLHSETQAVLRRQFAENRWALPLLTAYLVSAYLIYALGTDTMRWESLGMFLAFATVPLIPLVIGRRSGSDLGYLGLTAVALIWLPFDFGLITPLWPWPSGQGAYILNVFSAASLTIAAFPLYRGLKGVGLDLSWNKEAVKIAARNFVPFFLIALAFGLPTGFIHFNPKLPPTLLSVGQFIATYLGIFLAIALPEELMFRGIIQNILGQKWQRPRVALLVTASAFGLAHLNNGPAPDWRYGVLATVAGLFYGNAYIRSRALLAPALLHAMVDTVWLTFFLA